MKTVRKVVVLYKEILYIYIYLICCDIKIIGFIDGCEFDLFIIKFYIRFLFIYFVSY